MKQERTGLSIGIKREMQHDARVGGEDVNLVRELVHGTSKLSRRGVKARASEETEVNIRANKSLRAWCKM